MIDVIKTDLLLWCKRFLILLRRQLKKSSLYLIILFCLGVIWTVKHTAIPDASGTKVGLFAQDDPYAKELLEETSSLEGPYEFLVYPSLSSMKKDVTSGKLECGVFFTDKIGTCYETLKSTECITLYSSPATTKGELLKEKIYTLVLMHMSDQVLRNYSTDGESFKSESSQLTEALLDANKENLKGDGLISVVFQEVDSKGNAKSAEDLSGREKEKAQIQICVLLTFAACLIFADQKFSSGFKNLCLALRPGEIRIFRLMYILIPAAITGLVVGVFVGHPLILLAGSLISTAWVFFYSSFFNKEPLYLLSLISVLLLALISDPHISEIPLLIPFVSYLKYLFPLLITGGMI